ncbi:MAG TPA: HAD family hydrolase [Polyangiaceae bacterium]|nr:HAD family hydrolase [Polyangiaceae bacterium]
MAATTDPASPSYVAPSERIAVFDNDGTLWSEQPVYFQLSFALDYAQTQLAKSPAPSWASRPWATRLKKEGPAAAAKFDEKTLLEIVGVSEAQEAEAYRAAVADWFARARHPRFERRYDQLTFAPMVSLLGYLRERGYKTFIVTGGSLWFVRAFAEEAYGVPPEQVVGTTLGEKYELQQGRGVVTGDGKLTFVDDGPGKPVGIHRAIGRRPIIAVGNSDGDREMLEYTTTQAGRPTLGILVHHDDPEREWAYDRASPIGRLDKALDQVPTANWLLVSMKDDFEAVYEPAPTPVSLGYPGSP